MALLGYRERSQPFAYPPDWSPKTQASLPDHYYTPLAQLNQELYALLAEADISQLLTENELPHLANVDIGFFTTFAGVGHNRVCTDVASSLLTHTDSGALRMKVELDGTLAGKAHHAGSNDALGKWLTEFTQRHFWAQWLSAGVIHELVLLKDHLLIRSAVDSFMQQTQNQEVMMVAYHHDVAYVLGHYKEQFEKMYQKKITVVTVMTDHMPERAQFGWYSLYTDALITPDAGSARVARRQLQLWNKRFLNNGKVHQLPFVEHQPYPVNPLLTRPRDPSAQAQIETKLQPDSRLPISLLVPLGGSAPQQTYLKSLVKALPSQFEPHLLFKASPHTLAFAAELAAAGISTTGVETNKELLTAFIQKYLEASPEIIITKPSELHAMALIPPHLTGGSIVFFSPPVGDQEVQNVEWLQSHGLVPSDQEHTLLYQSSISELRQLAPLAKYWRAIKLPNGSHPDPIKAAIFISKLKTAGILSAMMQYRPNATNSSEISCQGSTQTWRILNELQAKVVARRQATQVQ